MLHCEQNFIIKMLTFLEPLTYNSKYGDKIKLHCDMLSQLEQACKSYSTESSSGLIEFDCNWQRTIVTALTFLLVQAITGE